MPDNESPITPNHESLIIIGCLTDPAFLLDVSKKLFPEDFIDTTCRQVYDILFEKQWKNPGERIKLAAIGGAEGKPDLQSALIIFLVKFIATQNSEFVKEHKDYIDSLVEKIASTEDAKKIRLVLRKLKQGEKLTPEDMDLYVAYKNRGSHD